MSVPIFYDIIFQFSLTLFSKYYKLLLPGHFTETQSLTFDQGKVAGKTFLTGRNLEQAHMG